MINYYICATKNIYMETAIHKQDLIIQWAKDRNFSNPENYASQAMKVIEEAGELFGAILKKKRKIEKDSFGDLIITIVILAEQRGIDLKECIDIAYNEIKDRKGKVVNGSFIKEENL